MQEVRCSEVVLRLTVSADGWIVGGGLFAVNARIKIAETSFVSNTADEEGGKHCVELRTTRPEPHPRWAVRPVLGLHVARKPISAEPRC